MLRVRPCLRSATLSSTCFNASDSFGAMYVSSEKISSTCRNQALGAQDQGFLPGHAAFVAPPDESELPDDARAALAFRRHVGRQLLQHIERDLRQQGGHEAQLAALQPGPPVLHELRVGCAAVLRWFESAGVRRRWHPPCRA